MGHIHWLPLQLLHLRLEITVSEIWTSEIQNRGHNLYAGSHPPLASTKSCKKCTIIACKVYIVHLYLFADVQLGHVLFSVLLQNQTEGIVVDKTVHENRRHRLKESQFTLFVFSTTKGNPTVWFSW